MEQKDATIKAPVYVDDYGSGQCFLCEQCFEEVTPEDAEGFTLEDAEGEELKDRPIWCQNEWLDADDKWQTCGKALNGAALKEEAAEYDDLFYGEA